MRFIPLIALLGCVPLAAPAFGATGYVRPELLAEPAELDEAQTTGLVILDARDREQYEQAHIPGALWVDHDLWSESFDEQDAAAWSERIGSLGISAGSSVVVYDHRRMRDAARIWWILRYWGVEHARVLNGGWKQWQEEQRPTGSQSPTVAPVAFDATPREERLATAAQVLRTLPGHAWQIVDARSDDEFCGIDPQENRRAGAIPGARNLEWSQLVDEDTHRIKSADELRRMFAEAGIDLQRPSATHCQSGGRSSVMVLAMELMGAGPVRNYYPGWSEWGNRDDTPVVVPDQD